MENRSYVHVGAAVPLGGCSNMSGVSLGMPRAYSLESHMPESSE